MKIISKYTDYYDWVQCYGIDDSLTYVRHFNSEIINSKIIFQYYNHFKHSFNQSPQQHASVGIVGFCGKIYPYIVTFTTTTVKSKAITPANTVEYSDIQVHYTKETLPASFNYYKVYLSQTYSEYLAIFDTIEAPIFVFKPVNFNLKTGKVVDIAEHHNINNTTGVFLVNPILAEYFFQNIVPAESAYQQIAEYLAAKKTNNQIEKSVSDTTKILRAGFDIKTSFRG